MANEARLLISLQINKDNLQYQGRPTAFQADVDLTEGPTPGFILVSRFGTAIDFSQLTTPGLCRMQNYSQSNSIAIGIYNTDQAEFYPFMYLKPGESYVLRLHPEINEEYAGTGTGTTSEENVFWAQSENANAPLLVEAFGA